MPVRSSSSPVLIWPDAGQAEAALRLWAADLLARGAAQRVGSFGSLMRGDWGVGSDLDIVVIVGCSGEVPARRAVAFDTACLPVPADVLVYTEQEWEAMVVEGRRMTREVRWIEAAQ